MKVYLCRWPNGDVSLCTAESKLDAISDILDEVGGASRKDLHQLNAHVAIHLHLTDDGRFELEHLDERNQDVLWKVYPHLFGVLENEDADDDAIREAVRVERGGPPVGASPLTEEMLRHYLIEFDRDVDDLPKGKWTVEEATELISKHADLVAKGIADGVRTHVVGDKVLEYIREENDAKRMALSEEFSRKQKELETPRARQKRLRAERNLRSTDATERQSDGS
jgi:hypothetical protein